MNQPPPGPVPHPTGPPTGLPSPPGWTGPQPGWNGPPQQPGWTGPPARPGWTGLPAQPGWNGRPAQGPPALPGPGVGTHLKRAVDWNVAEIVVTPRERARLDSAGVGAHLHGLFAWRRSTLLVAFPFLLLGVVLSFVDAAQDDKQYLTGFGVLWDFLPPVALLLVPLGALAVMRNWVELRRGSKLLIGAWLLSIALPLLAALVPLEYLLDVDQLRAQSGVTEQQVQQVIYVGRLELAITFAITLLPVVVSVPGGVLKGASRVKSLFPAAPLPGWFLVAVAPFYSLFTVVVFALVEQLVGNGLLLVSVAILAFTPWLFVIYRKVYGRPLSKAEARGELARASRLGGLLTIVAVVLLVAFMFTAKVNGQHVIGADSDDSVITYLQLLKTLAEVFGRSLVSTVVFSAILVSMVFAEWRLMSTMRQDIRLEHDAEMRALARYVDRSGTPGGATWIAPAAP